MILNNNLFNAALLISKEKTSYYTKEKLMPFGEYFPFKKLIHFFNLTNLIPSKEFTKNASTSNIKTEAYKIGTGICLEAIYQNIYLNQSKESSILILLSNSAWFFNSIAAQELFEISIVRAVENNRYLLHAANTGISAVISNKGEILAKTKLNTATTINQNVKLINKNSLFSIYGNTLIFFLAIIICFVSILNKKKLNQ